MSNQTLVTGWYLSDRFFEYFCLLLTTVTPVAKEKRAAPTKSKAVALLEKKAAQPVAGMLNQDWKLRVKINVFQSNLPGGATVTKIVKGLKIVE